MPLSDEQRKNLKDRFVEGVKNAFNGDPGNTIYGQPVEDFIAGPAPSGPLGKFQHDSGRRICRRWAAGRTPNILPGRDIYYRQLCEPYIEDTFGPLGDGTAAPPFVGGQCPAMYRGIGTVSYDRVFCGSGVRIPIGPDTWATEFSLQGPISGISARVVTPGACGALVWAVFAQTATGERLLVQVLGAGTTFNSQNQTFTVTLERAGGEPDNCGNLPDDWTPGIGPTIPPETGPIPDPPGWPIPDFDIDINVDPDGTINIDFGDGEPPEEIDPDPIQPPALPPVPPPGDQGESGAGGEAGEDDAEGEAPPGQVLVGIRLQLISPGPRPKVYPGGVYRGAAYIYMGGDVSLDQDFAGSLLINDQFIYAEKDNLTRWRVSANAGFRWNVTPYYREAE